MACVHDDNGRVRIHHFYNVGQWAKEIKRNPARDEEGIFENNRVTCRFKRPLYVPREETLVDLHLSWYYLFAWGPAIQGEWWVFSIKSHWLCFLSFVTSPSSNPSNRFHNEAWHRQSPSQRAHDQYLQVRGHLHALHSLSDVQFSPLLTAHSSSHLLPADGDAMMKHNRAEWETTR